MVDCRVARDDLVVVGGGGGEAGQHHHVGVRARGGIRRRNGRAGLGGQGTTGSAILDAALVQFLVCVPSN
jgi:hypothetical protein